MIILNSFRFLPSSDAVSRIRACFAGLYSLGENEPEADDIVTKAIQNPENYVLKPQREVFSFYANLSNFCAN